MTSPETIPASELQDAPPPHPIWLLFALCVVCSALLAFAGLQLFVPRDFDSKWGFSYLGVHQYAGHLLGHLPTPIAAAQFGQGFRVCLGVASAGFALAVIVAKSGTRVSQNVLLGVIIGLNLTMAIFCPPSMSSDMYAYVGYARLQLLYHLSPYTHPAIALLHAGDPTAKFLEWNLPTVYGSVWTLLSYALVGVTKSEGLFWQILAMKLLEALALIGSAMVGQKIAERILPGSGPAALIAIGLNPLFVLEGSANGHNDFLMMFFLLLCLYEFIRQNYYKAALFLGFSIGIKIATILVIPWLIIEICRGKSFSAKAAAALTTTVIAFLPIVLGFIPLWDGPATLSVFHTRSVAGAGGKPIPPDPQIIGALTQIGLSKSIALKLEPLAKQWPILAIYIGLTAWQMFRRPVGLPEASPGHPDPIWITAWIVFITATSLIYTGVWFPWYFCWSLLPAMTNWQRNHLALTGLCFVVAIPYTMLYALS